MDFSQQVCILFWRAHAIYRVRIKQEKCAFILPLMKIEKVELVWAVCNLPAKVRPSYDPSCAIFSWLNLIVIFNIASADIITKSADAILKMTMKIESTEDRATRSKNGRTLAVEYIFFLKSIQLCKQGINQIRLGCNFWATVFGLGNLNCFLL